MKLCSGVNSRSSRSLEGERARAAGDEQRFAVKGAYVASPAAAAAALTGIGGRPRLAARADRRQTHSALTVTQPRGPPARPWELNVSV
ncbi:hypothetical protein MTO96_011894 [Rhipicephalus appendiculatus]